MIAVGVCMIPMLGYYPLVQSWYGAMCNVKGLAVLGWPVMIYVILQNEGVLCAVKYGWMLGATGLFLVQYKRVSEKLQSVYGSLYNNTNWRNNGSHGLVYEWNDKRRAVCPDSHCSANMVYHSNFFSTNQKLYVGI